MSLIPITVYGTSFTSAESTFLTGFADLTHTHGDVFFVNASGQVARLAAGTDGQVLTTHTSANDPTWTTVAGAGTVTSVSVTSVNGISGTVATATTTPAISLTLGDITPTSVTTATVIGGTGIGSSLTFKSTSGVGTTDFIKFNVGNNGATEAMRVLDNGNVGIGNVAPASKLTVGATNGLSDKLVVVSDRATPFTNAGANGMLVDIAGGGGIYMTGDNGATTGKYEAFGGSLGIGTMTNNPVVFSQNNGESMRINIGGNVGIGVVAPTAILHLKAGTITASTAPLKFSSGSLLTIAEAGSIEFLTDAYYGTITTGAARKTFAFLESPTFTGTVTLPSGQALIAPALGTPASGTLTNCTGLPISTGVSGLATGVATFLGTPSSANLVAAVTDETGTGALVFGTSPTFTTSIITPKVAAATNNSVNLVGTYNTIQTYTPAAVGTATLDLSLGNVHHITMPTGNITIALSNGTVGQCFIVRILQDIIGSRTVTWFTTIKWAGGSAPTLTTTASKADTLGFEITGTNTYDGFIVGANI